MKEVPVEASTWLNLSPAGEKSISISHMADLFSLNAETLRKYDSKKIISAFRDGNEYRKYSSWEVTKLIWARALRAEGYSLDEIAHHTVEKVSDESIHIIEEMQKKILAEIVERQRILKWLEARKRSYQELAARGDQITVEIQPEIWCCSYLTNDTMAGKKGKAWNNLKEWMKALPFVSVYYVGDRGYHTVSCVGVTAEEREKYGLHDLAPDFILPEQVYLTKFVVAEHSPQHDTSNEVIQQGFEDMMRMGYPLQDLFVMRVHDYVQKDGIYRSYNKMMIPVQE
jgi:DNA-binding transcriptional MerR regulator